MNKYLKGLEKRCQSLVNIDFNRPAAVKSDRLGLAYKALSNDYTFRLYLDHFYRFEYAKVTKFKKRKLSEERLKTFQISIEMDLTRQRTENSNLNNS